MAERQDIGFRTLCLILLLLSAINCAPAFIFHLGGDIFTHLIMLDCFSTQFWQGDLYPRWCMNINSGLGAPLFLFYAPLPYYAAALLKPLGFSLYGMLTRGYFMATLITAIASYSWLRDIAKPKYALIATAIFLFMPYRMEVMYYRSGYSELWQIAFVPLIFKYARRLAYGDVKSLAPLALCFTLSFLSHVPCTLNTLLLSGIYFIILSGKNAKAYACYALAIVWAAAIAASYLVPGTLYHSFVHTETMNNPELTWPNLFFSLSVVKAIGLWRPGLLSVLTIFADTAFFLVLWLRREQLTDIGLKREFFIWGILALIALFLFSALSAPLFALLGPVAKFFFPWRMQIVFALAGAWLAALWMQHLASDKRRKTLNADMGVLIVFMALMSYFQLNTYSGEGKDAVDALMASQQITMPEYQSRWTDDAHFSRAFMRQRRADHAQIPQIKSIQGAGRMVVVSWDWHGILLDIDALTSMTIRLDHTYFPIWRVQGSAHGALTLHGEEGSGQMILNVPPGVQRITIYRDISAIAPLEINASQWIGLFAFLLLFAVFFRRGSFDIRERT